MSLHRLLARVVPLATAAAIALPAPASASTVVLASGNFHLVDHSVGCHWTVYGPRGTPPSLGIGSVRCERYATRSMVSIDRYGAVRRVASRWSPAVLQGAAQHAAGWSAPIGGTNLQCSVLSMYSISLGHAIPRLQCDRYAGGRHVAQIVVSRDELTARRF
jgi:hypothetical protein